MIQVLLAVYNGEDYIADQLNSLLSQSYSDWSALIHDDCSSDNSMSVVNDFVERYPDKFNVIHDNVHCGSAQANFIYLMNYVTEDYVMFCDQDDVWNKDKMKISIEQMQYEESRLAKDTPLLVVSNLQVTDSNLAPLKIDMDIHRSRLKLNYLLVENEIAGCCMMLNRSLCEIIIKCKPNVRNVIMHDWYIVLVAFLLGKISIIDDRLMYYRQHSDNTSGAVSKRSLAFALSELNNIALKSRFAKCWDQAKEVKLRYGNLIKDEDMKVLDSFISIEEVSKMRKCFFLLKGRFLKSSIYRVFGQLLYI